MTANSPLRLCQEGGPTTTVRLSKEQGAELRALLEANMDCRLTTYCHKVGLAYSNLSNALAGRSKVSLKTLERIFSGTDLIVECQVEFIIREGHTKTASDVDSQSLEDILFLEDMDDAPKER